MNIHDLRAAQVRFENRLADFTKKREQLHQVRADFVRYFTRKRIRSMAIDSFVLGVERDGSSFNFCYGLERQLAGLGRTVGATAFKFGLYYGRTKSDSKYRYRFTKKYGRTLQAAFSEIKRSILDLLDSGEKGDIKAIEDNPISAMFKGKILSTYFPERYLNVFSSDHLNFYLTQLDLDTVELISADPVTKREALVAFKNQDLVMKNWTIDSFAYFLYTDYPGRPPKEGKSSTGTDPLADYRPLDFPTNPSPTFITLNIKPPLPSKPHSKHGPRKKGKDYENEARKNRQLGDRGEKIVMDLEESYLKEAGRPDLAKQIKRVSLKSDSYGYDIQSFKKDGSSKLIEVKATKAKVGPANFFLTANELRAASENDNYFIYMVYDIMSNSPKVWSIDNPFNPENRNAIKRPTQYRVTINATTD